MYQNESGPTPQGGPGASAPPQYRSDPQQYGSPTQPYGPAPYAAPANPLGEAQGFSIAGMVLGIISIPLGTSIIFGILGLVFSIMGEKRTPPGVKNSYAKAGKTCSIIGLALGVLVWVFVIALYASLIAWAVSLAKSTGTNLNGYY